MKVTVKYGAQLRQAVGTESQCEEVESPCSVEQLVEQITKRKGEDFQRLLLDENGGVHPSTLLFVGEEQIQRDMPVELKEGDVVTILTPISGG